MDNDALTGYCTDCAVLERSLQDSANQLRAFEDRAPEGRDYFRERARLLIRRNRILNAMAAHQHQHAKAS